MPNKYLFDKNQFYEWLASQLEDFDSAFLQNMAFLLHGYYHEIMGKNPDFPNDLFEAEFKAKMAYIQNTIDADNFQNKINSVYENPRNRKNINTDEIIDYIPSTFSQLRIDWNKSTQLANWYDLQKTIIDQYKALSPFQVTLYLDNFEYIAKHHTSGNEIFQEKETHAFFKELVSKQFTMKQ